MEKEEYFLLKSIFDETRGLKRAFRAWVFLWFLWYVLLRVILRLLIGKARRQYVQDLLGLHYSRGFNVVYGDLLGLLYEPHVRRIIKQCLKDGGVFIDVGAYVGVFSEYAYRLIRKKTGLVVAVEPDPDNYSVLRALIPEEVKLVNAAIWIENGFVKLRKGAPRHIRRYPFSKKVSDSSTLVPQPFHEERGLLSNEFIDVRSIRLDTLIRQLNLTQVDLIKMDIEGAELYILTDPNLDLTLVKAMIIEVHYPFASPQSKAIASSLRGKSFQLYPIFGLDKLRYHLYAVKTNKSQQ